MVNVPKRQDVYTMSLNIRFTKEEYEFIESMAENQKASKSDMVRRMIWFYRLFLSEDLSFWKIAEAAMPKIIHDRLELLHEIEKDETSKG